MSKTERDQTPDQEYQFPDDWPYIPSENITIGNPRAAVALATLWTQRNDIVDGIDPTLYAIAGQLYEKYGIAIALRNLAANPHITDLVLCGADLAGSGNALAQLWKEGLLDNHTILGIEKFVFDKDFPRELIDVLRSQITLHDLRELSLADVRENVEEIARMSRDRDTERKPVLVPLREPEKPETFPSFTGVEVVSGRTVAETWFRILQTVDRFGMVVPTKYGNSAKDVSNLVAVVHGEDYKDPSFIEQFPFTRADLESFVEAFMRSEVPTGVSYTYGSRMLNWGEHGIDQSAVIERKLLRDQFDRGAIAVFHDPYIDNQVAASTSGIPWKNVSTPCITLVQARIVDERLMVTAYLRSNEMYKCWPRDAYALAHWQGVLSERLGVRPGAIITISNSAHLYDDSWEEVHGVVEKNKSTIRRFEEDPRGNVRIRVDGDFVILTHIDTTGKPLGPEISWKGTRKKATVGLGNHIAGEELLGTISHGLDVGRELMKAELAAKTGLVYSQDNDGIVDEIVKRLKRLAELEQRLGPDSI